MSSIKLSRSLSATGHTSGPVWAWKMVGQPSLAAHDGAHGAPPHYLYIIYEWA
jgi:hypothetical protein